MADSLTFGSLFAGIGGFDLGLERAGMRCEWQVEIDPYCRRVLEKHWPHVRRHDDVRTFPPAGAWRVDLICGGFPCQDISRSSHTHTGIDGERSGLWAEFGRIVGVLRPRHVVVENVPDLLVRGFGRVLGDLASLGFDAEWSVLPACALGASHPRERLFVVAHARGELPGHRHAGAVEVFAGRPAEDEAARAALSSPIDRDAESRMDRVSNGVPHRMDRIRGLGNAVVPQVAEWIGRRIVAAAG